MRETANYNEVSRVVPSAIHLIHAELQNERRVFMFRFSVLTAQNAQNVSSKRFVFPCQELWDLGARKHTIATETVFTVQNCD